jgi:hypothetical protein
VANLRERAHQWVRLASLFSPMVARAVEIHFVRSNTSYSAGLEGSFGRFDQIGGWRWWPI